MAVHCGRGTYRLLPRPAEDRVEHRALGVVDVTLDVALDVLKTGPCGGLLGLSMAGGASGVNLIEP